MKKVSNVKNKQTNKLKGVHFRIGFYVNHDFYIKSIDRHTEIYYYYYFKYKTTIICVLKVYQVFRLKIP